MNKAEQGYMVMRWLGVGGTVKVEVEEAVHEMQMRASTLESQTLVL